MVRCTAINLVTEQAVQNKHSILIIGIGNPYRGDDAVGLRIAQDIKKKSPDHVNVIEQSGDGISLMDSWKDSDAVILIDAVHSGAQPGTIHRFDVHTQTIPPKFPRGATAQTATPRALKGWSTITATGFSVIVYGIEG